MIQQLILNTLLACQPKTDTEAPTIIPPEPKKEIKTETPKKEPPKTATLESSFVTFVDKVPEPQKPNKADNFYAQAVRVEHLPDPSQEYTDEKYCEYVCAVSYSHGFEELANINNCKLQLLPKSVWESKRQNFDWRNKTEETNPVVGAVECNAVIMEVMEGRLALSPTKGSKTKDDLGGYFARAAQEEMTAVFAFQEMKENLKSFGAPQQLLDDCEKAIIDEQRHMIMMSNMAKRHGCESISIQIPEQKQVSLFELAKHNAIAGCIDETWSALVAEYRARQSKHYAKLFKIIAKDEVFHAQLSWDIHQWLMTQLSEDEKIEIRMAMKNHLQKSPLQKDCETDLGQLDPITLQKTWSHFGSEIQTQIA